MGPYRWRGSCGSKPSLQITFFAPDTGNSVSFPGTGSAMTDYNDDTAIVALDGFLTFIRQPGEKPLVISVGRLVFTVDVIGTTSDGFPITGSPDEILFESGVQYGSITAACEALAP
jgi:hypothetical protein